MASKPFMIRLDDATRERWEGAAGSESLSSFVTRTVDEAIDGTQSKRRRAAPAAASVAPSGRSASHARTSLCEHRVPSGSFCKRCD